MRPPSPSARITRGGLQTLIDKFNEQHEGGVQVEWRETPAAGDEYFEQMLLELQHGKSGMNMIGATPSGRLSSL